jgi:triosephosphate isomerase
MKKPFLVANWKATKTIEETRQWIEAVKDKLEQVADEIVICPPHVSLEAAANLLKGTNLKLGAQDVSKFRKGAFTGEITVEMISPLVGYCIVGHSERRRFFGEEDEDVIAKVGLLIDEGITPILCVSDPAQLDAYLHEGKTVVERSDKIVFVYEPPHAISGGSTYHPEDPAEVAHEIEMMQAKLGKNVFTLYGGSVNPSNIKGFLDLEPVKGALIGQASTDPQTFIEIISASA